MRNINETQTIMKIKIEAIEDKLIQYTFQVCEGGRFTVPKRIKETMNNLGEMEENTSLEEVKDIVSKAIESMRKRQGDSQSPLLMEIHLGLEDLLDSLEIEEKIQTIEFG